VLRRLTPYGLLAALALLFFTPLLLHPTSLLYSDHSDFLVQYLPAKHFLIESWRADGELPLWCPYVFSGMPFVHDIQVGAFYPPQAILYLLPSHLIGPAMCWLVVTHVVIAGWGAYAWARAQGLQTAGALVAGLGFMFGGKWMLHLLLAGHHTFAPIAWLPLVTLLLEGAVHRAGRGQVVAALLGATWAGALLGVMALGAQPQLTFYAGLFLAAWTLGPALEGVGVRRHLPGALARWAALGAWAGAWAAGLAAVQLLPTAEAARETSRAVSGAVTDPLNTVYLALISLPGPLLANETWEYHGGLGFLWVVAAALAPILCRSRRVRFQAMVTIALVLFAVGGPLLEGLPVLRMFRIPPRMLLIASLPISLLAGTTTQALFSTPLAPATTARCRRVARDLIGLLLLGVGMHAFGLAIQKDRLEFRPYWAALALIVPAALWLPGRLAVPGRWRLAWVLVLLLDLWALALPLVAIRTEAEVYAPTDTARYLAEHAGQGRVLDRDAPARLDLPSLMHSKPGNTPLGFAQPLLRRIEAVRGLNPIDVYRYKKYVQFVADQDEPVSASGGIYNFEVKNRSLLDLLGTRHLVQPSAIPPEGDGWQEVARDPEPVAFGNVTGGMQALPSYTIYENRGAFPRAFVVPAAAAFPDDRSALATLKATDFRRTVLLEPPPEPDAAAGHGEYRPVVIREYRPNRVTLDLGGGPGGYLVLTDVWFPGWTCTVDGQLAAVSRADYAFRAVRVPDGAREVVFRFAPESYRLGQLISLAALGLLAALSVAAAVWLRRRGKAGACG
jgi:hypothetical protein